MRFVATLHRIFVVLIFLLSLYKLWPSDRWPVISGFAYIPTPLLLFSAILLCIPAVLRRKRIILTLIPLILLLLGLIAWENRALLVPNSKHPRPSKQRKVRIFHWNVWGARKGVDDIVSEIAQRDPDIICISEYRLFSTRQRLQYAPLLNGEWEEFEFKNILILSRIPLVQEAAYAVHGVYGIQARAAAPFNFSLLFLDVSPSFEFDRLVSFSSLLRELKTAPDIIVGDFNTPPGAYSVRSTFGAHYQDVYAHGSTETGYTWPSWFPMLRIDLMLTNGRLEVVSHDIESSGLSDHRWQYVDVTTK